MTLHKIQLPPDTNWAIQFRRANINEIFGPELRFKTIKNTKPPEKPSTPVATAVLGQLVVTWDGLAKDGSQYLPDLNRVEIHVGIDASFVPSPQTMIDQFSIAGSVQQRQASGLVYGTTYYVKLVAVNNSDIRSEPSDESHDTIRRISGIEIEDGSISIDKTDFTSRGLRQTRQYNQASPPSLANNPGNPPHYSDTWFDTDDKYRFYVYDHATPFRIQGANESWEAYYDANDAANDLGWREIPLGTANQTPGARVIYSATDPAPTATPPLVDNDTWFKTGGATGSIVYSRKSNAWVAVQFGLGTLGPGSVVGDNIVGNTITGNKIVGNSITTTQLAANSVTTSQLAAGSVTANAVGTNTIVAYNANIANGVIDDAKIANLSAGKILTGSLTATISITSGLIRTATTGGRAEFDSAGIRLYNSFGSITLNAQASTGYATLTGNVIAQTFRSQGYQTGGYGYIEIGNTGTSDPTDEVRMFYGGTVSSIRNPSDAPGALRLSLQRGGADTIDFTANTMQLPNNSFRIINRLYGNTFVAFDVNRIIFSSHSNAAQSFMEGADGGAQNFLWRIGNDNGGAVKLSKTNNRVQIRNSQDNAYGLLEVGDLIVRGTYTGPSSGGALPTDPSFNSVYVNGTMNAGYVNSRGGLGVQGTMASTGITTANGRMNIYASDGGNANIASYSGGGGALKVIDFNGEIQARTGNDGNYGTMAGNFRNASSVALKENIKEINLDALSLIDDIKFVVWDWKNDSANQEGMGFLLEELPAIFTPKQTEESYANSTMQGFQMQVMKQLKQHVIEQEYRIHQLESAILVLQGGQSA